MTITDARKEELRVKLQDAASWLIGEDMVAALNLLYHDPKISAEELAWVRSHLDWKIVFSEEEATCVCGRNH